MLLKQNYNRLLICLIVMEVLCFNAGSFYNSFTMVSIAGWIGTEVNNALTS